MVTNFIQSFVGAENCNSPISSCGGKRLLNTSAMGRQAHSRAGSYDMTPLRSRNQGQSCFNSAVRGPKKVPEGMRHSSTTPIEMLQSTDSQKKRFKCSPRNQIG